MSARRSFLGIAFAIALLAASPAPSRAQDEGRVAELERKVTLLTQEVADLKLGAVADTTRKMSRFGLGPAASKVYSAHGVSIGGYGEMLLQGFDRTREDDTLSGLPDRIDYLRQVLYFGYKFSDDLYFNSEVELEHTGVRDEAEVEVDPLTGEGAAELTGEVVLEFAFVDWQIRQGLGVRAGMLLVPLGWTNELHEPPIFMGARRPDVEQRIIPTTWAANGAGIHGETGEFAYRAYVLEGLNAEGFSAVGGIRGGRQNGSQSLAVHPAFAGRLDWTGLPGVIAGVSGFTGSAWQGPQPGGPSLTARVSLIDFHARAQWRALETRALVVSGTQSQAAELSDALGLTGAARLGERFAGGYVEAAYDVAAALSPGTRYGVRPYARFERFDTQDDVPGGSEDPAARRTIWTLGAALSPHPDVVVKIDRQIRSNDAETETNQWNVALGYLF